MIDRERSQTLYNEGRAALETGQLARAAALFRESAALSPHFKTLELLGEALLRSGDPLAAIEPLAAATALNAQVRAPSMLAEAFLAIREHDDARHFAESVLARDPMNKRALNVLDALDPD